MGEAIAFDRVEPGSEARQDYRFGVLAALVLNVFARRRGDRAAQWFDLFPEHDPVNDRTRRQTPREIWTWLEQRARAAGFVAGPAKPDKQPAKGKGLSQRKND